MGSCKKDEFTFDREDDLAIDTALLVYHTEYISHTGADLTFSVDMLVTNGTESEQDYSDYGFVDTLYETWLANDVSQVQVIDHTPIPSYSTVLLFDLSELDAYDLEHAGYYLRRYFELADSLPNRQVALSAMSTDQNLPTHFFTENPGNIFGNSWEFNNETFLRETTGNNYISPNINGLYLKQRLTEIIDSVVASPYAQGELSITILGGYANANFTDNAQIDEIVDYANLNNVRINVITMSGNDLRSIAMRTGGFYSAPLYDQNWGFVDDARGFSPIRTTLANLDKMLTHNVFTHRCVVTSSYTTAGTWNSGDQVGVLLNYSGFLIDVTVRIP